VESVISASLIVLVIRSRRSILHSRPGKYLFITTLLIVLVTLILPYTPLDHVLGFSQLPASIILIIIGIVILYIFAAEFTKRVFYRLVKQQ
jgi:Mg2+-importing ATPase